MIEDTDLIPHRSPEGQAALDIFYDEFNDIHFYVEDEDQENIYEVIFRKLFPLLTIARVIPLGGKQAVLRHAADPSNAVTRAFRAYIVDKDLDDLLALVIVQPNIFYLDWYCIENYLIDESAIVELVIENHPKVKRHFVADALTLPDQFQKLFTDLRPLFALFFCVQRLDLGISNCGAPAERYCVPARRWELDPDALSQYRDDVLEAARHRAIEPELADPFTDSRTAGFFAADPNSVVSGKYVCTMLHHYVKSKFGLGSMTFDSFVYRLAKNSSLTPLLTFAERVSGAAAASHPKLAQRLQVAQ